ncbi:N-acetyltransferase [Ekhidna sp.]|uniref:GNAT family N-acetyltransferase n=1 Tax=Ekhidna sp. TaxID=2608089 RepID=UPI0032998A35
MIRLLDHKVESEAISIRQVFQISYAIEAELLQAKNFPPLKRPLADFIASNTSFYGFFEQENLAAVIEVKNEENKIHIHSLVVAPTFFRRGIASKLLNFLFSEFDAQLFIVETGAANGPAISLYERHGFKLVKKWMTEIGIEKVAFERKVN